MAELNQTFAKNALKYVGRGPADFRKWYYGKEQRGVPWSSIFVSYIAGKTGILNKIVKKCAGAGEFAREGVAAKWGTWHEGGSTPQVGDIISFVENGLGRYAGEDKYYSSHVGVVYKVDSKNKKVYTVEGNVGKSSDTSKVVKREYALKDGDINGYYRPNWKKMEKTKITSNQTFAQNALSYVGKGPTDFRKWYDGAEKKGVPWCAIFVSYVANETGILDKIVKKCNGAGDFARKGVAAKWGTWHEGGSKPQVGDIISFVNNELGRYADKDIYYSDHVGIVYKVDSEKVYTVEGNTGSNSNDLSCVNKRSYSLKDGYINGYYRPNWGKVPTASSNAVLTIKSGYLREQPWYDDEGGTSRKICVVPEGAEVVYVEDDEWGWGKIIYKDQTGWIQNSRLNKKGISTWRYATFTRDVTCEKVKDAKTKKQFEKGDQAYVISLLDTGKYKGKAIINSGGIDYYISQSYIKNGSKRMK